MYLLVVFCHDISSDLMKIKQVVKTIKTHKIAAQIQQLIEDLEMKKEVLLSPELFPPFMRNSTRA